MKPASEPIKWWLHKGYAPERLGYLPGFIFEDDPRPMAEQINERYVAGWSPFQGFTFNPETHVLEYPGDPVMKPFAGAFLRQEALLLYPHNWAVILNMRTMEWEAALLD